MSPAPYDTLADVYEWLVPEAFLTPEWTVDAFAPVVAELPEGARVLDCACGIGQLAVGLHLRGFDVTASDASPEMVRRTRTLAADREVDFPTVVCRWEDLGGQGWDGAFDAVFCVGNSLTHAPGQAARRTALEGMAAVLPPDGLLVLTSRNWEQIHAHGSCLEVGEQLVERHGRRALVVHAWTIAPGWDDEHALDIAVAFPQPDGRVTTYSERLALWTFRHETLDEDLRAAGLTPATSSWADDVHRYAVTARVDAPTRSP
jgi:SAM-dependent methyltransferase